MENEIIEIDIKQIMQRHKAYINGRNDGEKTALKDIFQLFYDMSKEYGKIELDAELIKEMAKIYEVDLDN